MPKYYVIPIDAEDNALLGVRALLNPHTNATNWCAGTPSVFGGNAKGSMQNTLYLETREESHFRIDIDQYALSAPGAAAYFQLVHQHGIKRFYALRERFSINVNSYFPAFLANRPDYRECTGEIVRLDLRMVNAAHRTTAGGDAMRAMQGQRRHPVSSLASSEFLGSEMAEAIRLASLRVQAGQI
jgi:hypothetical protein